MPPEGQQATAEGPGPGASLQLEAQLWSYCFDAQLHEINKEGEIVGISNFSHGFDEHGFPIDFHCSLGN